MRVGKLLIALVVAMFASIRAVSASALSDALGQIAAILLPVISFRWLAFVEPEDRVRAAFFLLYFIMIWLTIDKVPIFRANQGNANKAQKIIVAIIFAGLGTFFTPAEVLYRLGLIFPIIFVVAMLGLFFWFMYRKNPLLASFPKPAVHIFRFFMLGFLFWVLTGVLSPEMFGSFGLGG